MLPPAIHEISFVPHEQLCAPAMHTHSFWLAYTVVICSSSRMRSSNYPCILETRPGKKCCFHASVLFGSLLGLWDRPTQLGFLKHRSKSLNGYLRSTKSNPLRSMQCWIGPRLLLGFFSCSMDMKDDTTLLSKEFSGGQQLRLYGLNPTQLHDSPLLQRGNAQAQRGRTQKKERVTYSYKNLESARRPRVKIHSWNACSHTPLKAEGVGFQ